MKRQVRAGMTTKELDEIGGEILMSYGPYQHLKLPITSLVTLVSVSIVKWLMGSQGIEESRKEIL